MDGCVRNRMGSCVKSKWAAALAIAIDQEVELVRLFLLAYCFLQISAHADRQFENRFSQACYNENHSFAYWGSNHWPMLCAKIQTEYELNCIRSSSSRWRKACPGIDTQMKLSCVLIVDSVPGYSREESIAVCRNIKSEKELACLSEMVSSALAWYPLNPSEVSQCLEEIH
ncbi:MAG: hypothetical protein IPK68_13695 [Bdellovibrionales bacterium]|nr:hypothetical protein [Bdellovibrionales bacterium]